MSGMKAKHYDMTQGPIAGPLMRYILPITWACVAACFTAEFEFIISRKSAKLPNASVRIMAERKEEAVG